MRPKKISLIKAEVVTRGAVAVVYRHGPQTQNLCNTIVVNPGAKVLEIFADFLSDLTVIYNKAGLPPVSSGFYQDEFETRNECRIHVREELEVYKRTMGEIALHTTANEVADMLLPGSGFKWESDINSVKNEFTITFTVLE